MRWIDDEKWKALGFNFGSPRHSYNLGQLENYRAEGDRIVADGPRGVVETLHGGPWNNAHSQMHLIAMLRLRASAEPAQAKHPLFPDTDQHITAVDTDNRILIPATLLKKQGWAPGTLLLLEKTDDGVLITTVEQSR